MKQKILKTEEVIKAIEVNIKNKGYPNGCNIRDVYYNKKQKFYHITRDIGGSSKGDFEKDYIYITSLRNLKYYKDEDDFYKQLRSEINIKVVEARIEILNEVLDAVKIIKIIKDDVDKRGYPVKLHSRFIYYNFLEDNFLITNDKQWDKKNDGRDDVLCYIGYYENWQDLDFNTETEYWIYLFEDITKRIKAAIKKELYCLLYFK